MEKDVSWIPRETYEEIVRWMPICTVDIILFDRSKKKVLLFKRMNKPLRGTYFAPGGRILKDEDLKAAVRRQTKKELGIELDEKKLVFGGVINELYEDSEFDSNYHSVDIYWGYVLDGNEVFRMDDQHSHYDWFDINDGNFHPYIKEKISGLISKI